MNAAFWITATKRVFVVETSVALVERHVESALQNKEVVDAWIQDQDGDIPTLCIRVSEACSDLDLPSILAQCLLATFGAGKWIVGGKDQALLEEASIYARDLADEQHSVFIV